MLVHVQASREQSVFRNCKLRSPRGCMPLKPCRQQQQHQLFSRGIRRLRKQRCKACFNQYKSWDWLKRDEPFCCMIVLDIVVLRACDASLYNPNYLKSTAEWSTTVTRNERGHSNTFKCTLLSSFTRSVYRTGSCGLLRLDAMSTCAPM